jgi:histidine ammonia-lyase
VNKAAEYVSDLVKKQQVVYGITTGFGVFDDKIISSSETTFYSINLLKSQCLLVLVNHLVKKLLEQ